MTGCLDCKWSYVDDCYYELMCKKGGPMSQIADEDGDLWHTTCDQFVEMENSHES